jgi:dienelactone hydrolase
MRTAMTVAALALLVTGCALLPRASVGAAGRTVTTSVALDGKTLDLRVSEPRPPVAADVLVLYASGDGGWFGAAVDMFKQIAAAGYPAAGFSSRAFLKIDRPRGALVSAAQLAAEYEQIIAQARRALGLGPMSRVVLTGWSRGAAFSVLVASEPAVRRDLLGVVAIGLDQGEDLQNNSGADDSDDGPADDATRQWPFDTYARIAQLGSLPCAVIQATKDHYFPAVSARQRFGPDTPQRRFYSIDARNHRFSGGKAAFDAALLDAITWIVAPPAADRVMALR